ncbi:hypothetical protein HYH03_011048 [Edaphochlamys debaryana]|uniref:Uncharacterized protein n=1 Tax=Edaphochlamys debaryana TaxID=47281 RepID=A0A836BVP3_9CHLO|nr:hypothetical protein HYH03_011048 [Edaphochlamys debaryana]|eukprot:KAG2490660.1 hypothetical protein HYH03_011048 [Edaphochlamys debaryana]
MQDAVITFGVEDVHLTEADAKPCRKDFKDGAKLPMATAAYAAAPMALLALTTSRRLSPLAHGMQAHPRNPFICHPLRLTLMLHKHPRGEEERSGQQAYDDAGEDADDVLVSSSAGTQADTQASSDTGGDSGSMGSAGRPGVPAEPAAAAARGAATAAVARRLGLPSAAALAVGLVEARRVMGQTAPGQFAAPGAAAAGPSAAAATAEAERLLTELLAPPGAAAAGPAAARAPRRSSVSRAQQGGGGGGATPRPTPAASAPKPQHQHQAQPLPAAPAPKPQHQHQAQPPPAAPAPKPQHQPNADDGDPMRIAALRQACAEYIQYHGPLVPGYQLPVGQVGYFGGASSREADFLETQFRRFGDALEAGGSGGVGLSLEQARSVLGNLPMPAPPDGLRYVWLPVNATSAGFLQSLHPPDHEKGMQRIADNPHLSPQLVLGILSLERTALTFEDTDEEEGGLELPSSGARAVDRASPGDWVVPLLVAPGPAAEAAAAAAGGLGGGHRRGRQRQAFPMRWS